VFAAIKLSSAAAQAWSSLMAMVGFPWTIVGDTTDLVALPLLWLSWRTFPRAMAERPAALLRRSAELVAAGTGLLCCVATSRVEPEPFVPDIEADVWVHNATDEDVVVRIRPLRPAVDLDCDAIAADPGALLQDAVFDSVRSWTVAPDTNIPVRDDLAQPWSWESEDWGDADGVPIPRDCWAALVDGDGLPQILLFWRDGAPPVTTVPGDGFDDTLAGGLRFSYDDAGDGVWEHDGTLVFDRTAPPPAECGPVGDAGRLAWSDPLPSGRWRILAIDAGVDGCAAFSLADEDDVAGPRWYACFPAMMLPVAAGDWVEIGAAAGAGIEGVRVTALDAEGGEAVPRRELSLTRGGGVLGHYGESATFLAGFDCAPVVDPGCGTVGHAGTLAVSAAGLGSAELRVGAMPGTLADPATGERITMALVHAEERVLLDPECAAGPDLLGLDLEVATAYWGAP
jgi:hypothetical protein